MAVATNSVVLRYKDIGKRQPKLPILLVSKLFFIWGFAYGLLDAMNKAVRNIMHIDRSQSTLLAAAYYGAYIPGALLVSGPIKKKWGYRVTFLVGLLTFALGCGLMWPAAHLRSYSGMIAAHFVVGLGISTLENSANPYVANCGPEKGAEMRMNFAQGFAALGTVFAPLVAAKVLFATVQPDGKEMEPIISLYRGMAIGTIGYAILFGLLATKYVPELDDEVVEDEGSVAEPISQWAILNARRFPRLWLATAACFFNIGAQVGVAQWFIDYCVTVKNGVSDERGSHLLSVAQALFCVGRFVACGTMQLCKPRMVLLIFIIGAIVASALAIVLRGAAGIAMVCLIMFFEAPTFPTIFATGEKGLGRFTKTGSNILIASIAGGALQPPLMGLVTKSFKVPVSFAVPLIAFSLVSLYTLYINVWGAKVLDKSGNTYPSPSVDDQEMGPISKETISSSTDDQERGSKTGSVRRTVELFENRNFSDLVTMPTPAPIHRWAGQGDYAGIDIRDFAIPPASTEEQRLQK